MTETLLGIIAAELGAIFFAMVAIFGMETYSLYLRSKEQDKPNQLRILTKEELIANGIDPNEFMNGNAPKVNSIPTAAHGEYL